MTSRPLIYRRLLWLTLAIALASVTVYSQIIHARYVAVREEVAELEAMIAALPALQKKDDALHQRAKGLNHRTYATDVRVSKMLRQCSSREDYLVREGPRIVRSPLSGGAKALGLYLPDGRHTLKVAVAKRANAGVPTLPKYRDDNARAIESQASLELGPSADVYEIRLLPNAQGPLRIEVYGKDTEPLLDSELPEITDVFHFVTLAEERHRASPHASHSVPDREPIASYPSEFVYKGDSSVLRAPTRPATDVARLAVKGSGNAYDLRIWIESDAKPCMPATAVAAHYRSLTGGEFRISSDEPRQRMFARLFLPYDGGDRFYFRDSFFIE
jgi:hypothetical protein